MSNLANAISFLLLNRHKTQVLFDGPGAYARVRVTKTGNRVDLTTGKNYLQSSYDTQAPIKGSVWSWYLCAPAFSGVVPPNLANLLVLGLGGGSIVKLFNRVFRVKKVVGVEIDPLIVELSKNFFGLDCENITIENNDIADYCTSAVDSFDTIILDAFRENISDPDSLSAPILKKCSELLAPNGVFTINRVGGRSHDAGNKELINKLKNLYKYVYSLTVFRNVLYACTNSKFAPPNPRSAERLIHETAALNKELSFMTQTHTLKISLV